MFYRKFLLTLVCCNFYLVLSAQQEQIQFSRLEVANGLSHNQVNAIFKDARGLMWFGTLAGLDRYDGYEFKTFKHDPRNQNSIADDFVTGIFELPDNQLYLETRSGPNIYDPASERFSRNVRPYLQKLGIHASVIRDMLKDKEGNFWFNAAGDGLFRYNPALRSTLHLSCAGIRPTDLGKSPVASLQRDEQGNIWVIHGDKSIERLDGRSGKVRQRILAFRQASTVSSAEYRIFVDHSGAIWMYTLNTLSGIAYFDPRTGEKRQIEKGPGGLNNNLVNGISQDPNGLIWIATDHGGVNLLDKQDFRVSYLLNKENDPTSLGQNSVLSLYKDDSGIMWLGTFKKGVSFYHEKILKFPLYRHQGSNPGGLSYEDVNRFVEDGAGNIWIGTNGGGLFCFNRHTKKFKCYRHETGNAGSLSNDIIVSLYVDRQQILWIGSYFGGLTRFDGHKFTSYKHSDQDPASLADDRVWDILEDHQGNLWIATLSGGLDKMDRKKGTFSHNRAGQPGGVGSDYISCLITDTKGNLWIGTSDGIDERRADGTYIHYQSNNGQPGSLVNNIVYDLMQDSHGFIWIATRDGISRLDPVKRTFRNFGEREGLTEKSTLKIVEDNSGNLWLSTANGLFNLLVSDDRHGGFNYTFRKYTAADGLQGSAFNANAGYKTRAGELLFGGANGFNLFRPELIKNDHSVPRILFTDLQLANRSVRIGEKSGGHVPLTRSIAMTRGLNLDYDQNGFTLAFAALNYFNPQKIRYRYMLEGFDHHWQEPASMNRRATYTNIDPGKYVFKVMSTDASGNWVNNTASLQISIRPPFWRTTLAYLFYILGAGTTLLLVRRRGIRRIRKEFNLEQERQQAKRMHELDLLKIKFLTNVSHEFRTPLSLIITPLEKLIRQAAPAEQQQLQMIQRNGRRLLNLVNQLLDFRKMEEQELKLHPKSGDLIQFTEELTFSFSDVAERKGITLLFQSNRAHLITRFDHDKIERILFNLLSNAFKFTPEGGKVTIRLTISAEGERQAKTVLEVSDTGIGIPVEKQEKIFERFFQHDVPDSLVNQGSGIGLSITREFVRLHGGTISVQSAAGGGSVFTVILYLAGEQSEMTAPQDARLLKISPPEAAAEHPAERSGKSKKQLVLLVEDNEDFRFYLKDNLREFYQIAEAANGREGWQKILALHPDLVVSDVSMPEMNGTELCRKIKSDKRTAHLPVILLTALITEDQQLTGLETGASDYMTKPFNFEILLSKIRNLLQQQALAKRTYQKQVDIRPAEAEIESLDDKFVRQLCKQVEKNLSDPAYSVDQLSADVHMSRVGLYKKVLPLTGKSPVEFIRAYRLEKAKPLLLRSQLTIAEVAYEVGFSNPKQFSKYFKQQYGILPSAYAQLKPEDKAV